MRQQFARHLVEAYGYRKPDLGIEFKISIGSRRTRADIVIFNPGRPHDQSEVVGVVETKRRDRPANKNHGRDQLFSYMSACPACRFGILLTQETKSYLRDQSDGSIHQSKEIPKFGRESRDSQHNRRDIASKLPKSVQKSRTTPRSDRPAAHRDPLKGLTLDAGPAAAARTRAAPQLGAATVNPQTKTLTNSPQRADSPRGGVATFWVGALVLITLAIASGAMLTQCERPPGAVQGLRVASATQDLITLTWDPPENAASVAGYEIVRELASLPDQQFRVVDTSFTDSGLSPDSQYRYRVRAEGVDGSMGVEVALVANTLAPPPTPDAIAELRAASATAVSITLTWDPPANADSVQVSRYEVFREVPRLPDESFSVAETTLTDSGLSPDSQYRYRVRAVGVDGEAGPEVDLRASTLESAAPPDVVRELRAASATAVSITLTWDPPANADSVQVSRYEVFREVPRLPDESFSVAETTLTDSGLSPDSQYRYRVRAVGVDGEAGPEVDLRASTLESAAPPDVVRELRAASATAVSITLTWDPPANADSVQVSRYEVFREVPRLPDESFSVAETTLTDSGLSPDSQYRYRVRAVGVDGEAGPEVDLRASTSSLAAKAETGQVPGVVRNLRFTDATQDSITLSWDPPANADSVQVSRYEIIRVIPRLPDERFSAAGTSFTQKGLSAGSEYRYRVRAVGPNGAAGPEVDLFAMTQPS